VISVIPYANSPQPDDAGAEDEVTTRSGVAAGAVPATTAYAVPLGARWAIVSVLGVVIGSTSAPNAGRASHSEGLIRRVLPGLRCWGGSCWPG
jgi:hypothetical protein